ncbi:membrane protein of unknown function [Candidatus Methylopumilus turicensis]|uniref:Uncharacterized protein n=1 Tax=Candidatus Methylopumilus turicensis TaxID=1581680 RepID=A0A0B7J0H9_9PROT|nr:membrane protein of unknown function [Candidatus Methylopumilus turicensis]
MLLLGTSFTALTHWYGRYLMEALLPLYHFTIHHVDSRIDISSLIITWFQGQQFVQFEGLVSHPFFIGEQYYFIENARLISSRIPLDYALQPVVIFFTLVLAWPADVFKKQYQAYFYRISFGAPLILILMLLDFPMQFIYMLWANLEKALNVTGDAHGLLLYWSDFLNGGGLIMLSIAISVMAIGISSKWMSSSIHD